jgi:dTMP kinase
VVYQGYVRGFGIELIEQLNNISTKETYPDVTLLLDVDVKTGLQRREDSGKKDRLDMEAKQFHQKVRDGYLELAKENQNDRWVIIDANKSIEAVEKKIWEVVEEKLV